MPYDLYDRILGALLGAAAGDGMGAATEARSTAQIKGYFGGTVRDFIAPPKDTFGAGNRPGQATDDFSSAYFLAESLAENGGTVNEAAVQKALIRWSLHEEGIFFNRFAGPTTRLAIRQFKGEDIAETPGVQLTSRQATNGGAMRISPVGLFHPGALLATVEDSVAVVRITHNNYLAISGACAVSAAVSRALMPDADLYNVLRAAFYGALEGERLGREQSQDVAGPSVLRRMEKAVEIGLGPGSPEEKMLEIGDVIGTGLHVSEAVPAAIGLLAAAGGDAVETVVLATNVGYDTDTIATMCGAIAGALQGATAFPKDWLPTLEEANGLEIQKLAKRILPLAQQRLQEKGGE